MSTAPSSAGEMGLALAALLILFFPLMQPAVLLVVMFALVPAQSGVQAGMPDHVMDLPQSGQTLTQPKSVKSDQIFLRPDKPPPRRHFYQD